MQKFYKLLANTLIANITTSFLWWALTFWIYLETKSVMATAFVGGSYMLSVAFFGLFFGTYVDKHKKKQAMIRSSSITLIAYILAGLVYMLFKEHGLDSIDAWEFWLFTIIILFGSVVEGMRNIALSTTVTFLVPKKDHAKANGLIGSVTGISYIVTSVFSGLAIGYLGLGWTIIIAIVLTFLSFVHLLTIPIPESKIAHDPQLAKKRIDVKGSLSAIRDIPGLMALLFFNVFNNLIGGVFMALMDPYGLTLFSVQLWGVMSGIAMSGFIVGGLIIGKKGLGKNPLRTLLLMNIAGSIIGMLFTVREWAWLYVGGMFFYMCLIPVIEAAEQTVIQRVVPHKKQGRVFGFAQSLESAASPITAFAIGPIAQFLILPYMNGAGERQFAWLLGTGEARGIALIFLVSSIIMLFAAIAALRSSYYHTLSAYYKKA